MPIRCVMNGFLLAACWAFIGILLAVSGVLERPSVEKTSVSEHAWVIRTQWFTVCLLGRLKDRNGQVWSKTGSVLPQGPDCWFESWDLNRTWTGRTAPIESSINKETSNPATRSFCLKNTRLMFGRVFQAESHLTVIPTIFRLVCMIHAIHLLILRYQWVETSQRT